MCYSENTATPRTQQTQLACDVRDKQGHNAFQMLKRLFNAHWGNISFKEDHSSIFFQERSFNYVGAYKSQKLVCNAFL